MAGDKQPQPPAGARVAGGPTGPDRAIEEVLADVRADAVATVGDRDDRGISLPATGQLERWLAVGHGVAEQIGEYLRQVPTVGEGRHRRLYPQAYPGMPRQPFDDRFGQVRDEYGR